MSKWFTYTSEIEFPLRESPEESIEKVTSQLAKQISKDNGEDATRKGNSIYFAVMSKPIGFNLFSGIDSGEVKVKVERDRLIVRYELMYFSPFLPILFLDLFFLGLSFFMKDVFPVKAFIAIITIGLVVYPFIVRNALSSFPEYINDVWHQIYPKKKY